MAATKKEKAMTFEERLEELETIARQMEENQLPLHKLTEAYQKGMQLAKQLEDELEKAKGRMVEVKAGKDGAPRVVPSDVVEQPSLLDDMEDAQ